jgi:hypothetical protein
MNDLPSKTNSRVASSFVFLLRAICGCVLLYAASKKWAEFSQGSPAESQLLFWLSIVSDLLLASLVLLSPSTKRLFHLLGFAFLGYLLILVCTAISGTGASLTCNCFGRNTNIFIPIVLDSCFAAGFFYTSRFLCENESKLTDLKLVAMQALCFILCFIGINSAINSNAVSLVDASLVETGEDLEGWTELKLF